MYSFTKSPSAQLKKIKMLLALSKLVSFKLLEYNKRIGEKYNSLKTPGTLTGE